MLQDSKKILKIITMMFRKINNKNKTQIRMINKIVRIISKFQMKLPLMRQLMTLIISQITPSQPSSDLNVLDKMMTMMILR